MVEARRGFKEETKGKEDAYTVGYRLLPYKVMLCSKGILQGRSHPLMVDRTKASCSFSCLLTDLGEIFPEAKDLFGG